jgi:hypothetical protein
MISCKIERWMIVTALLLALSLSAPIHGRAESRLVVAGPEYEKSDFHNFWWGKNYRDLWTTPIEVEVLDLQKEAGGLEVVFQVGGLQTPGLALKGANGKSYTFRSVNKDPAQVLPAAWLKTIVARQVRDQTAATHPGAFFVTNGLAKAFLWAAQPAQRLVVMPDDPALGKYRELFADRLGTFGEYPTASSDSYGGFKGATEILSSRKLWSRWLEGPENRVDTEVLLQYRIADLWLGNWDRHNKQWRWARMPGKEKWRPIAEDPDMVFSDYQGVLTWLARWQFPKIVAFKDKISPMEGIAYNGADIDRWILTDLERKAFLQTAREFQAGLTDEVIDNAVKRLPAEWYAINGQELAERLKRRRDNLEEGVERYYRHLAAQVNIHGTNRNEMAHVRRFDNGSVEVTLGLDGEGVEPYYRRRFDAEETRAVRIYLHGGNDRVVSEGPAKGRIKVQVVAGPGDDTLDDSRSGKTRFYDFEGQNEVVKGKGTRVDRRPWENPAPNEEIPWIEPRDFGSWTRPEAYVLIHPDLGVYLSAGLRRTAWSFRKYPFDNTQRFVLAYSTGRGGGSFDFNGSSHMINSHIYTKTSLRVSQLESLNFFGFGNETVRDEDLDSEEFYEVEEDLLRFRPTVNWQASNSLGLFFGMELQYTKETSSDTLIEGAQPFGSGDFGQFGLVLGFDWDSLGKRKLVSERSLSKIGEEKGERRTGIRIEAEGSYFPGVWDVEEDFGAMEGEISGSLGLGQRERVVLASRIGGRQVWGTFPWHEAAFIGGSGSNRGFAEQRFAGERAAYGSLELRYHLFDGTTVLFPGRLWIFGLADAGRVWVDGEDSDEWHPSYGGGVVVEMMATPIKLIAEVARNDDEDDLNFYFRTGFAF